MKDMHLRSSNCFNLLSLDGGPFNAETGNHSNNSHCDGGIEALDEGVIVGLDDGRMHVWREGRLETSSPSVKDGSWVDIRETLGDSFDKLVGKDVLANRDEESSSKSLEEDNDSGSSWHVLQLENGLSCNHRLLHAKTNTRSTNKLVTDPFSMTSVDFEGCKKTCTNGADGSTGDHERCIVTTNGDEDTCKDRENNNSQNQRKIHDSRLGSGNAFDGLEPDGNVEDEQHECRTNGEG